MTANDAAVPGAVPHAMASLEDVFEAVPAIVAYLEGPDHVLRMANDRYVDMVGGRAVLGRPVAESVPEAEAQGFIELLDRVRATGQPYVGREAKITLDMGPGGHPQDRWVDFTYQPVTSASGQVVGVLAHAVDVTEAVLGRQAQEDRFRQAIETMLDSVMICTPVRDEGGGVVDFVVDYVNHAAQEVGGRSPETLRGRLLSEVWPGLVDDPLLAMYVDVVVTGRPVVLDHYAYEDVIDGVAVQGDFDIRATRVGEDLFVVWRDVSERAGRERELVQHRASLDEAQRIARLGSWMRDLRQGHVVWSAEFYRICGLEPGQVEPSRELFLELLPNEGRDRLNRAIADAAATGSTFQIEEEITRPDGEHRMVIITGEAVQAGDGSIVVTRGTVQDVTDQRLVETALRHSEQRLEEEHAVVEVLQAAILPKQIPDLPGASIAAHYLAASENVTVGGDWYDVFPLGDGRVLLSVGDVAGKGVQAAEAVGQLRNSLRMAAVVDPDPDAVVRWVNELMELGFSAPFATAVVAFYDPATGTLVWANAGHLPLVVRHADGTAEVVGEEPTHLPLGVDGSPLRAPFEAVLQPGDSVALFTDGLVERPGEPIDDALSLLAEVVARAGADPEAVSEAALRGFGQQGQRRDDVCLLVLHREASVGRSVAQ